MFPFLNIFGARIPSYGLCIVIAIVLVCILSYRRIRRDENILPQDAPFEYLLLLVPVCMFSFLIGGKLLYVMVSHKMSYLAEKIGELDFSFLGGPGLVFYGGLIGGLLGTFGVAKLVKVDLIGLERDIVPFIPFGHAIGRIGCLLGGCCYGMEYSGPLAVYYENSLVGLSPDVGYFPVQPLESVLDLIIMGVLLAYSKKKRRRGDVLFLYLLLYAVMRFTTELFRGDAYRGVFSGISTSQWISIGLAVIFVLRLIFMKVRMKKLEDNR